MTFRQIIQVIRDGPITIILDEDDVCEALYEICELEHSSCNSMCPVYAANNFKVPWTPDGRSCTCFKNGREMFNFLKLRVL